MAPNPRVVGAFRAMKAIGISDEKVKPVLKNLIKLYNKNWDLIEEENYRVLADAIFESEEAKDAECKKSPEAEQDEPEPPLKRQRLKHQLSQPNESVESHLQNQSMGNESQPGSCSSLGRNKGKQPMLSNSSVPQDGPIADDLPHLEAPVAVVLPGSGNKGTSSVASGSIGRQDDFGTLPTVVESDTNDGIPPCAGVSNGKPEINTVKSPSSLEIASSLSGEVKIFLNCGSVLGRSDFHMPTLDAVVKLMEDKCLKKFKEHDPNFSVMKVMADVCQCFWEMGTESTNKSSAK